MIKKTPVIDPKVTIYKAINGHPSDNLSKVIELMGGIENVIGEVDVVIVKPNVQWWNQGAPNIAVVDTLISIIMNRPGGFQGEIVLAENNHRGNSPWDHGGWSTQFSRNSDMPGISNYNELAAYLKRKYGDRFSTAHWVDIDSGGKRVFSPANGSGYVICDGTGGVPLLTLDNGLADENRRTVVMSYPILQTNRGTVVDFKNGIWKKGSYTQQPIRFINVAALNHHSTYCGMTSAIKNYLGVCDLSGGSDPHEGGTVADKYYNFHSFPFDKWSAGPVSGMIGAEIGMFMSTVRKADLNITTAEWVGLASRTEPPVAHTRSVLACSDPVALDYHAAKYLLYPNSNIEIHNPDYRIGPLSQYLCKCSEYGGGLVDESYVYSEVI